MVSEPSQWQAFIRCRALNRRGKQCGHRANWPAGMCGPHWRRLSRTEQAAWMGYESVEQYDKVLREMADELGIDLSLVRYGDG